MTQTRLPGLSGREYQSRRIKNECAARDTTKERQRVNNQLTREFGFAAVLELQDSLRENEQSQIQEFLNKAQEKL